MNISVAHLHNMRTLLASAHSFDTASTLASKLLLDAFQFDAVQIFYNSPAKDLRFLVDRSHTLPSHSERARFLHSWITLKEGQCFSRKTPIALPLIATDVAKTQMPLELEQEVREHGVKAFSVFPLFLGADLKGWVQLVDFDRPRIWHSDQEITISALIEILLNKLIVFDKTQVPATPQNYHPAAQNIAAISSTAFRQVAELARLIYFRTDSDFKLQEVVGNTEQLIGLAPSRLIDQGFNWTSLVHPSDLRRLSSKVGLILKNPRELNETLRVLHHSTKHPHWIRVGAIPLYDQSQKLTGWEGTLLETTHTHQLEHDLARERQRVQALYRVSSALHAPADPAIISLRGLRELLKATRADCGFVVWQDAQTQKVEVVAADGLSEPFISSLSVVLAQPSLIRRCLEGGEGLILDNIQTDSRATFGIAKNENLKSTIIAPGILEDKVWGAIVLFRRQPHKFVQADLDLVLAASYQIGMAARQAELYNTERKNADSLSALYRLSHELSKQLTPKDVAEHAFAIIQSEVSCKRLWFGVTNDQGTHIVGQAGYGPGIRRPIIDIQIELDLRHDFLDDAIRTRQAVVVEPSQKMECSGLNRIMAMLNPGTFVVVPLLALGQLVGLLVVEPAVPSVFFSQKKLPLLTSMASEIATVILARRFESRMAEADKMRMAGLLASGIAHNFNNLLQAVMGQASLLEMQLPKDSPLNNSTRMILSAATKGAHLIKQLLNFSARGSSSVQTTSLNQMINDARDLYRTVLGTDITLSINLSEEDSAVAIDYGQIQQVLSNLLVNAKEAIGSRPGGIVRLTSRKVRLRSGEVDPELAPGEYVRLDIEDNGAGMDAEHVTRCFEPFFTTKNADNGTGLSFGGFGLGLSAAYSILRHHQGLITVSSTVGDGAVFSLYLPLATVQKRDEVKGKVSDSFRPETLMVIVLDFDPSSAFALQSALESLGIATHRLSSRTKSSAEISESIKDLSSKRALTLLVMDADTNRVALKALLSSEILQDPTLDIALITADSEDISNQITTAKKIEFFEKPLDTWQIPALLRRLQASASVAPLQSRIVIERTTNRGKELEATTTSTDIFLDQPPKKIGK